jgi:hypothetical protein
MKTVFINLKEGERTSSKALLVNDIITLDESFIDMGNYLNKEAVGALIYFNSQQIIQLNLTKVSPYILLFFDDSLLFKGATHSIVSGTGSFSIQTEYKQILFVKIPHDLKLNTIISLNI